MKSIICGHFNFIVRDSWLLCQDCNHGISINSLQGQRLLDKKRGKPLLDKQQQATHDALVESYKELVAKAGANDPTVLADWANKNEPN